MWVFLNYWQLRNNEHFLKNHYQNYHHNKLIDFTIGKGLLDHLLPSPGQYWPSEHCHFQPRLTSFSIPILGIGSSLKSVSSNPSTDSESWEQSCSGLEEKKQKVFTAFFCAPVTRATFCERNQHGFLQSTGRCWRLGQCRRSWKPPTDPCLCQDTFLLFAIFQKCFGSPSEFPWFLNISSRRACHWLTPQGLVLLDLGISALLLRGT